MITPSTHRNQTAACSASPAALPALLSKLLPAPAPETSGSAPRTGNGLRAPTSATGEPGTHLSDSLHLHPCILRCGNLCMIPACIVEQVRRDRCVAVTSITVHRFRCAMCDARLAAFPLPGPFCYLRWRTAARNTFGDRGAAVSLNRRDGSSPLRRRPFGPDGVNRKQGSSFDARRRFLSHPTHR